jgi:PilZ domain-containing protein
MSRRNPPRYSVQLPVSFAWDRQGKGTVHNLSVKGCLIQSEILVTEGDYFSLNVGLRGQEYPVSVKLAAVRWAKGYAFGTEFLFVEDGDRERLQRYLSTCWEC